MSRPTAAPAPSSAPVKRAQVDAEQFYEERDPEAGLMGLSIWCLITAAVLLGVQLISTDRYFSAPPGDEASMMIPQYNPPKWEERDPETRRITDSFSTALPDLPQ
jgi:hypothetical protein